ncbi:MAG TPA: phenylalanine--tRNA ligase subunit alpha [Chloroflexia bacterium]|nr:phenylalanine--tRNA ligase subunit alpha [Chloroflexia bacterium]
MHGRTVMDAQVHTLRQEAETALEGAADLAALGEWKAQYLGDRGALTGLLRGIGQLPKEERPAAGQTINAAKRALEARLAEAGERLAAARLSTTLEAERLDVTLPGRPRALGHLHITTQTIRDVVHTFEKMGFAIVEGPEIELDYFNFELLNIPPEHPARSQHDTFYVAGSEQLLLRTHTSPNQLRTMQRQGPPIRVVVPGKCYRAEATDATHEAYFYQIEGLAVDRNVTLADLKGTLAALARALFGSERKVRFRCDYFSYVEPGVDLAIDCLVCGGPGCRACKFTGYLEIMGAGMVHPQVLRNGGIDPAVYSGFAFGMGVERIAMLRHAIDDIRLYYQNDLRFLRQFNS